MSDSKEHIALAPDGAGVVNYKGHSIFPLYPNSGKKIEELLDYSAILIHAAHSQFASFTIQKLRAFNDPRMYLKPIFFLEPSIDSGAYINSLIDGSIFNLNQLDSIVPRLEDIQTKINQIKPFEPNSYESLMVLKFLQFAFTRNRKLIEPIPYHFSGINYAYPGISANFEHIEEHRVYEILELAEKEGLIKGEFYDKTHYCNQCNHGSLNYRSVCPKCHSSHSVTEEIIHHFPCGNVGPMSDYKNTIDDSLNCPKCNKILRHIGVDYDKPSVLHFCQKCANKFQDFDVKAKCLHCHYDNNLEMLIEKTILQYTITNKGENAAIYGHDVVVREIEELPGTVTYDFFQTMTKFEIERLKVTNQIGNIAVLHIPNANVMLSKVGKDRSKILLTEIVSEIRRYIRPYDIIAFKNASVIVMSMNDISIENATIMLMEVVDLLRKLLHDNVDDFLVQIENKIVPLNAKLPYKNQIDDLVSKFN
jgi:hypothetical protein